MIREENKAIILLVIMLLFYMGCARQHTVQKSVESNDQLERVFSHATNLIDKGNYTEAARIYQNFLQRYPAHDYADDAAYRLAYLHIMADPANPLCDYKKAYSLFQNFIETYKNSRYINACKNWLAVLQPRIRQQDPVTLDTAEIMQLRQQISEIQSENQKLKTTLAELQQAIER